MSVGVIHYEKKGEQVKGGVRVEIVSLEEANDQSLWTQAAELRGKVYIDEFGWLPEEARLEGCETDSYDLVSDHYAVTCDGAVFAHTRYIHWVGGLGLPIEAEFNVDLTRQSQSVEVSRLIARHTNSTLQNLGGVAMITHAVGYLVSHELDGYAILEKPLIRRARSMGLVINELAEPMSVGSYGGSINYPVGIDAFASMQKPARPTRLPYHRFFELAANGCYRELGDELMDAFGISDDVLGEAA